MRRRLWLGAGNSDLGSFAESERFLTPDEDLWEMSLVEMPVNIESSRGRGPPLGRFDGFFRAPVSGNYSFLVAVDNQATVHYSVDPQSNYTDRNEMIATSSWIQSRQWGMELESLGMFQNPISAKTRAMSYRSRTKLSLTAGQFIYLEGSYRSPSGGDNFAIGAILHNASVNRKHQPAALDEKQLIDIDVVTQHEVQQIELRGSTLAGTFRLGLGGKKTRAIDANASAAVVAAAVRELLSNCEGDIGLESGGSGSTFECWQGTSNAYRGLKSTTAAGVQCKHWIDTPYWDVRLAMIAGLDANLCRNPDYRASGPWCVDSVDGQVKSCSVPHCGQDSAHVMTFEDEEAGEDSFEMQGSQPFTMTSVSMPVCVCVCV